MPQTAEAGRRGPDVRSDCWVQIAPATSGKIEIEVQSKVAVMYGEAIRRQLEEGLAHLGVAHARVRVEDAGAPPFVIAARLEAAARRAYGPAALRRLLPADTAPATPAVRDRLRRSRLYLPGNEPKFLLNAALHEPDGIILDLEDSVAPAEKDTARLVVRNALRSVSFLAAERMVRINPFPLGREDLAEIAAEGVELILIPKCEGAEDVRAVDAEIQRIRGSGAPAVLLMPIVETALGILRAHEIATASPNVVALTVGLEDLTADLGTARTDEGRESLWARSMVVHAARAAGVAPIDSVYSDVGNEEGLRASVLEAKGLGFEGKGCIHPGQIRVIHDAFAPTPKEVERAQRIVTAFEEAEARGVAVVSLGSKMIDPPVVKRALRMVDLAVRVGRLAADWRGGVPR
jgi:citrate lyase subunit beta/citryl-CoA lyase